MQAQQPVLTPGSTPGEFSVSPSGAATYTIPLQVPPGVAGMAPRLALVYSSQGGNGMLGMGWGLSGLSAITRCPQTRAQDGNMSGVNFDMNDRFCLDGQRLVVVSGNYGAAGSEYRTELDSFSKIIANGQTGNGPASFTVKTKSGLTMEYGTTTDSFIEATGKPTARVWAQSKVSDVKGNFYTVSYNETQGAYYPVSINYSGNSVAFNYETRPDTQTVYEAGSSITQSLRMVKVKTIAASMPIKEYRLDYVPLVGFVTSSRPSSLTECNSGGVTCMQSLDFSWQDISFGGAQQNIVTSGWNKGPGYMTMQDLGRPILVGPNVTSSNSVYTSMRGFADVNGDGKADLCRIEGPGPGGGNDYYMLCTTNLGTSEMQQNIITTGFNKGPGYDTSLRGFVDVNGDGKADLCRMEGPGPGGGNDYYMVCTINLGTGGAQQNIITTGFNKGPGYDTSLRGFADVNGDGRADLCRMEGPGPGGENDYHMYCTTNLGVGGPQQNIITTGFNKGPGYDTSLRGFVDVNGDGKADLCRMEGPGPGGVNDYHLYCTTNLGVGGAQQNVITTGFNKGPGYETSLRGFVDINGDGKADLCRMEGPGPGGENDYHMYCTTNLGAGGAQQNVITTGFNKGPGYDTSLRGFVDVNSDGKADLCRMEGPGPGGVNDYYLYCTTNLGVGGAQQNIITNGFNKGPGYDTSLRGFADVNGDGKADLCRMEGPGPGGLNDYYMYCTVNVMVGGERIEKFINNKNSTAINYDSLARYSSYKKDGSSSYPTIDLQPPMYVVSSVSKSNGIGGTTTTNYQYGGLKAELGTGRGMLGFRWMKSSEVETGIERYTESRQDWPYIGMPVVSETRLSGYGNGGVLKRATNTPGCKPTKTPVVIKQCGSAYFSGSFSGSYAKPLDCRPMPLLAESPSCAVAPGNTYFPHVVSSKEESWDLNGAALPSITTSTSYAPENTGWFYGDPSQITVTTSDGSSKTTLNSYYPANTNNWILGRLKEASVTSVAP